MEKPGSHMGAGFFCILWGMAETKIGKETGSPGGMVAGEKKGQYIAESIETNGELAFPNSVAVYDRVRTDAQVESVLNALSLPILSANWDLKTEGVDETVVQLVRTELGLPEPGKAMQGRQRRQGISWFEHLEEVLNMLWAGFMCFEQVYEIAPARPDQEDIGLSEIIHLRKLAPRHPRTITEIQVEADGGLKGIMQTGLDDKPKFIPAENLVMYVHRKEGADWTGRSVLRSAYRPYFLKDLFVRLDAQAAERGSMGIPVVYYGENADPEDAKIIATNLRAGESAGIWAEEGKFRVEILGIKGTVVDLTPRINYHDQQIAKSALAMFLDLGHDSGARSLGETHLKIFIRYVQRFADKIAETVTEHIIRDLVELNFEQGTPYPVLTPGNLASNEGITTEALAQLVNAGIIVPDDVLEEHLRSSHALPKADAATSREPDGAKTPDQLAKAAVHDNKVMQLVNQIAENRSFMGRSDGHVPGV